MGRFITFKTKDEWIPGEENTIYAQAYMQMLVLMPVTVGIKLLFGLDSIVYYLPEVLAAGGSLLYLFVRYATKGILFKRNTDEYTAEIKVRAKVACLEYCLLIYSFDVVFRRSLWHTHVLAYGLPVFIWAIPIIIASVRLTRKGLPKRGNNKKKGVRRLWLHTLISSLLFGALVLWFEWDAENIWRPVLLAFFIMYFISVSVYFYEKRRMIKDERIAAKHLSACEP